MIRGIERLCDAYITLAYMDASRHKNEKSEYVIRAVLHILIFNFFLWMAFILMQCSSALGVSGVKL